MQNKPILVIDDEDQWRTTLLRVFNRSGYNVDSASGGAEAINKFKENDYGLVIADAGMPEMSGMEFLGKVKKISPDVPVIMVTGHGTINNAVEAMQKGAFDYILKPFSSKTIETAVKRAGLSSNGGVKRLPAINQSCSGNRNKKIITRDENLLNILKTAKNIASSNATVLIQGESGTGKELLASFIHQHGRENEAPYVAVNCAALPDSLAESELFGHERGSFTGAVVRKMGKFEMADGGTIILDEISEMTLPLQAKILRVLQEREIDRVGGNKSELKEALAQKQKLTNSEAAKIINTLLNSMSEALGNGENVEIRGFGSFSLHSRPARIGRNPKTGEPVAVAARHAPHFKPGKDLRERVNAAMAA